MKFVVIEVDYSQSEDGEPSIGRLAGPYSDYEAPRVAKDLADEATDSYERHEMRKLPDAELYNLSVDVVCAYAAVNIDDDKPTVIYLVKELLKV